MTITVARLLEELGNKAWSGFNKDDMTFSNEDAKTAICELNSAHRYLQSLEDFPFQTKTITIQTVPGTNSYAMPSGQIVRVYDKENNIYLQELNNIEALEDKNDIPNGYYVQYSNPTANLILYPTPNKTMNIQVIYNDFRFIIDNLGNPLNEFTTNTDLLNMPSYIEYLYMDCLILRTMEQNNKDLQDENYKPIQKELSETWANFKRKANPSKKDTYFVI